MGTNEQITLLANDGSLVPGNFLGGLKIGVNNAIFEQNEKVQLGYYYGGSRDLDYAVIQSLSNNGYNENIKILLNGNVEIPNTLLADKIICNDITIKRTFQDNTVVEQVDGQPQVIEGQVNIVTEVPHIRVINRLQQFPSEGFITARNMAMNMFINH